MLFVILILFVLVPLRGQETVKEEVKVVNVEVPVRVFCKGKPVDHLTIGDFKLYENKKKQRITSLKILRRKIKAESRNPCYFVLVFRVHHFDESFRQGVRYLFDHILRKGDTLMALINNGSMMNERLSDKDTVSIRIPL